jgi:allene oxide cyclase
MPNSMKLLPSLRLLCIVPIAACGLIAAGPAAAEEIKMIEHATTDAVTDTGAKGDSAGDILTFANEVFDADDKNKIGTDQGHCIRTVPGKAWECFWTVTLDKGQITIEGPFSDTGDSLFAITGGTGDFAQRLWHQGRRLHFHLQAEIRARLCLPFYLPAARGLRGSIAAEHGAVSLCR